MKVVFIDTETNGLPANYNEPYYVVDNWPMPIQVAVLVATLSGERSLVVHSAMDVILNRADAQKWDDTAFKTHRITRDRSLSSPFLPSQFYPMLKAYAADADVIVGHNIDFDFNVVCADMIRVEVGALPPIPTFCTMKHPKVVTHCAIPGKIPATYKWPKLEELYSHLFGVSMHDRFRAHDALEDIKATANVLYGLLRAGVVTREDLIQQG